VQQAGNSLPPHPIPHPDPVEHLLATDPAAALQALLRRAAGADKERFFVHPVTDDVAPGYSAVIRDPRCLQDMLDRTAAGRGLSVEAGGPGDDPAMWDTSGWGPGAVRLGPYRRWKDLDDDVGVICANAQRFNPRRTRVHRAAAAYARAMRRALQASEVEGRRAVVLLHPGGPAAAAADEDEAAADAERAGREVARRERGGRPRHPGLLARLRPGAPTTTAAATSTSAAATPRTAPRRTALATDPARAELAAVVAAANAEPEAPPLVPPDVTASAAMASGRLMADPKAAALSTPSYCRHGTPPPRAPPPPLPRAASPGGGLSEWTDTDDATLTADENDDDEVDGGGRWGAGRAVEAEVVATAASDSGPCSSPSPPSYPRPRDLRWADGPGDAGRTVKAAIEWRLRWLELRCADLQAHRAHLARRAVDLEGRPDLAGCHDRSHDRARPPREPCHRAAARLSAAAEEAWASVVGSPKDEAAVVPRRMPAAEPGEAAASAARAFSEAQALGVAAATVRTGIVARLGAPDAAADADVTAAARAAAIVAAVAGGQSLAVGSAFGHAAPLGRAIPASRLWPHHHHHATGVRARGAGGRASGGGDRCSERGIGGRSRRPIDDRSGRGRERVGDRVRDGGGGYRMGGSRYDTGGGGYPGAGGGGSYSGGVRDRVGGPSWGVSGVSSDDDAVLPHAADVVPRFVERARPRDIPTPAVRRVGRGRDRPSGGAGAGGVLPPSMGGKGKLGASPGPDQRARGGGSGEIDEDDTGSEDTADDHYGEGREANRGARGPGARGPSSLDEMTARTMPHRPDSCLSLMHHPFPPPPSRSLSARPPRAT